MIILTFYLIFYIITGQPTSGTQMAFLGLIDILNLFALLTLFHAYTNAKTKAKVEVLMTINRFGDKKQ